MAISEFAGGIVRSIETVTETLTAPFSDPVIRLGVTGLSRAGKTVFITSLVANLMNRGRMPGLVAAANGAIRSAYLQPQPDDTLPRFPYEDHFSTITGADPNWPEGTYRVQTIDAIERTISFWSIKLADPLPVVPVPLLPADVALQSAKIKGVEAPVVTTCSVDVSPGTQIVLSGITFKKGVA